jgi:hypothetical protein
VTSNFLLSSVAVRPEGRDDLRETEAGAGREAHGFFTGAIFSRYSPKPE